MVDVRLRELPPMSGAEWDRMVAVYDDRTIFHLAAWHAALERSLPGRVLRFEVHSGGEVCGHWCGFLLKKFGFRVFGAPLPGTATDHMYPLFTDAPPPAGFLAAVKEWAGSARIGMVELGGEYFPESVLEAHGYTIHNTGTYRVDLSGGGEQVWKNLKPSMKNKIRKAQKNDVVVLEDASPDFPRRFFDMLEVVFERQGLSPSYGLARVETIVETLRPSGNVVTLMAAREGSPLASVLLLLDHKTAYFWGGASYESAYPYGANDIIQWHALQMAIERGLTTYDTCGGRDYKMKFGGEFVSLPGGYLAVNPLFGWLRAAVRAGARSRSVVRGRTKVLVGRLR